MTAERAHGRSIQAVAAVLAAFSVCATLLTLIAAASRWPTDFAGVYAAARTVADDRSADVYTFSSLAQVNAVHHYVAGPIFPFVYSPFVLVVLRPLAALPFDGARSVWLILQGACIFGAALFFADAFSGLLKRAGSGAATWLREQLVAAEVPIGAWRWPALPFALVTAVLLLGVTPADAPYWGGTSIITAFLLALATAAFLRGRHWLAGLAAGLIGGFALWQPLPGISVLVCLVLIAFALRGAWQSFVWGIGILAATFLLSLLVVPLSDLHMMAVQQTFLNGVYATSLHNTSLNGLISNVLARVEHTGTATFTASLRLARILSLIVVAGGAVAGIALGTAAVALVIAARRSRWTAIADEALWPMLALALAVAALAPTLVWPSEGLIVAVGALLLLGWGLATPVDDFWTWVAVLGGALAVLLCCAAALSGSDWRFFSQGTLAVSLYLLRPVAGILVWVGALAALLGIVRRALHWNPTEARARTLAGRTVGATTVA